MYFEIYNFFKCKNALLCHLPFHKLFFIRSDYQTYSTKETITATVNELQEILSKGQDIYQVNNKQNNTKTVIAYKG
jgi:hypothetical protein